MPDERDIWQAANLLVGLYGADALGFVASRVAEVRAEGGDQDLETWGRITTQVRALLGDPSPQLLH